MLLQLGFQGVQDDLYVPDDLFLVGVAVLAGPLDIDGIQEYIESAPEVFADLGGLVGLLLGFCDCFLHPFEVQTASGFF